MIQTDRLQELWKNLSYSGKSEFEFTRIDSGEAKPEMNIGFNSTLNRCLLLELPKGHDIDFQKSIKQNLSLSFFDDTGYIVLELTDQSFTDLFNDLIISIYQHIYQMSDVKEYSQVFIQMFYKWSEFFDDKKSEKLSQDIIKGLFGELFVLKELIKDSHSTHINDLLNSWKGPYDKGHDFELDQKHIEVKTKEMTKTSVKISSEHQLESEMDIPLELLVLSVDTHSAKGQSLSTLVSDIKNIVISKLGDFSIVLTALAQKNITARSIYQYDNFRFEAIEEIVYNCTHTDFPKLTKTNTPKAIGSVQYTLHLNYLTEYISSKKTFDD
ncbi:PD-(D/E)XK motif protein [Sulfurimonas sp.]|uniref:PD-(D/E)XK motif protein n=1 Tax=Sulfurimonas sp. TaxID=2022749 RepID=UPI0035661559